MRRLPVIAVALAAIAAGPAVAQTQMDLNAQAGDALKKSDAQLNTVYTKLRAKISEPGKQQLQIAQQSWLRFRDQECEFESRGTEGGSIHSMIVASCLARLSDQRTKDLEKLLNCQEGDMSCAGL